MNQLKQKLATVVACCLVLTGVPSAFAYPADQSTARSMVQAAQRTPEQLQQLVAPIALLPDALVTQILAASTNPDQVVEAEQWMQQHSGLEEEQLARQVDQQPWDPSVKALTEFPPVLANMDKNRSWTSALGDAYVNRQQDVMNAVQVMRRRAQRAGNLESNSQQTVTGHGKTIVIESADPQIVYLPQYDPWIAYGWPVGAWPGWYGYPGLFWDGPGIGFGLGFRIGGFRDRGAFRGRDAFRGGFDRGGFHGRGSHHSSGFHDGGSHGRGGFHGGASHGGGFHGGGFHGGGFHGGRR
jgi:uncharacterized protein DUF3300